MLTIALKTYLMKYIPELVKDGENKGEQFLFECKIELEKIESKISDEQYRYIRELIEFFSHYKAKWDNYV